MSSPTFHNFLQSHGKVKKISNGENPIAEANHLQDYLSALDVKVDADAPNINANAVKSIEDSTKSANDSSPNKSDFSGDLPRIFREISNLTTENLSKSDDAETNPQSNQVEMIVNRTFENASSIDANFSRRVEASKVFEQIEKPILQAVIANAETDKPQILKLRLRPAELGAIEIRLEKTADGKIKVRFQTEAARHVLNESFDQLKTSLKDSGWQVEWMEVVSNAHQFSSSGGEPRENQSSRQTADGNQLKEQKVFGGDADSSDDSQTKQPNRLLSVRA